MARSPVSTASRAHPLLAGATAGARIVPDPTPPPAPEDAERYDGWGFADTAFTVLPSGEVELAGSRYTLSGAPLPSLLPWMRDTLGVELEPRDVNPPAYPPRIPDPAAPRPLLDALAAALPSDAISQDPRERLRHGHGHTQEEIYAIRHGGLPRVPDVVVWPASEEQVVAVVEAAARHGACLLPFGGGTNVSEALRCPPEERRPIVSMDLRRMNRILWLDPVSRMAAIEAGAVGRTLLAQLARFGLTLGHEPDSVEFSTLGGWIATHASGMKKNRYGNIEDLVLDLRAVTTQGIVSHRSPWPRESIGIDPRLCFFGSEGALGVVTQATVKLFPLPELQRYGSIIFPSFEDGVAFMYDLTQEGTPPASVRLVDNLQFQFSQALKPARRGAAALKSRLERWFVTGVRGFAVDRMVACTLVFEGRRDEVRQQEASVYGLARRHGGMKAGGENGERGYQLTFGIAYIRDFVMDHWILGESFETSVPWSDVLALCDNVKRRIWEEHQKRGLPGRPFVTCRVTQVYPTGVCVYFYFAFYYKGVERPSEVYAEIERAARDEVLRSGGSLSHHHGVGQLRERFLPGIVSPAALEARRALKRSLDPGNLFGAANQGLGAGEAQPGRVGSG